MQYVGNESYEDPTRPATTCTPRWSTSVSQTVTIPTGTAPLTLTYDMSSWMYTAHDAAVPGTVTLTATVNGVSTQLETYPVSTNVTPIMDPFNWALRTVDVSAFHGKTVTFTWTNTLPQPTDGSMYGDAFVLDNVSLKA